MHNLANAGSGGFGTLLTSSKDHQNDKGRTSVVRLKNTSPVRMNGEQSAATEKQVIMSRSPYKKTSSLVNQLMPFTNSKAAAMNSRTLAVASVALGHQQRSTMQVTDTALSLAQAPHKATRTHAVAKD